MTDAASTGRPRIGICVLGIDGGRSGIAHYTLRVLGELRALRPSWRVDLVGLESDRELFGPLPEGWTWHGTPAGVRGSAREILWTVASLPRLARRRRWRICFLPAGNRRLPWRMPCPRVGTVHDFSSLHVAEKYDRWRRLYIFRILPFLVRRLDRVISISRASARDILAFSQVPEQRIDIVPNGVTLRPAHPKAARRHVRQELGIDTPWLLYVSRLEHPGKNHVRLIEAFGELVAGAPELPHRLVLAGADWNGSEAIHGAIRRSPVRERILTPGFVDRALLHSLLDGADMMVFPSLYEGFGLPVLEAMAAGVPVACSRTSSLPEVGGDAATYFDPEDPASIEGAMQLVLRDPERTRRQVERGQARARAMSWRRTAELTVRCLERALDEESSLDPQTPLP